MLTTSLVVSIAVLESNCLTVGGILNGIVTSSSVSEIALVVVYEPSTVPKSAVVFSKV